MKNTIIIMTSNIGSSIIESIGQSEGKNPETKQSGRIPPLLLAELKKYFRVEFLNRIDDIVVYNPLGEAEIRRITLLLLDEVIAQLREKGISAEVTDALVDRLGVL